MMELPMLVPGERLSLLTCTEVNRELRRLRAENERLHEALRCIRAALTQPATYPADVALARRVAVAALDPLVAAPGA